jgi:hypothetical protein
MVQWLMFGAGIWYSLIALAAIFEGKPWLACTMFLYAASVGTLYMAATR